jgi:quercetin dioxygenase-like cupin family protein
MRKSYLVFIAGGIFFAAGITATLSQGTNPLDPLKVCPDTHKLLFENAVLRVIEAKVPPGSTEPKHSHPRGITVYLADYDVQMTTIPDNKVTQAQRKFGTVSWSEAVVHEVKNTGRTNSHAIRIELK